MRYKPCTVLYSCTHGMGHPVCVFVVRERRIVRILLSTDTFTLSDLRCRCADAKNNERFKSFNHACTSRLIINHAQFARLSQILVSIFDFDTPWRRTVSRRDWFAEKG